MLLASLEMNTEPIQTNDSAAAWHAREVYVMAAVCLFLGVLVGYLVRGSTSVAATNATAASSSQHNAATSPAPQQMPSLDDVKRMADKQGAPLLAKLQSDPNNADLLNQVGNLYRITHQFQRAVSYYQKALDVNPKNVGARTDMASCLFYQGDVDGAIAQLQKSLTYDPKHAGTLLNLGLVRWKGKSDAAGAIASWDKLLKYYPNYENKDMVQKLISEAKAHPARNPLQSE
jgi:tetratricopeptide (TPR) repeat protein